MPMKKCIWSLCALCAVVILAPRDTAAYFTKAQSAVMLEDGKGVLYSVTYDFGVKKYDVYLPIGPERKSEKTDQTRIQTYALLEESEEEIGFGETLGVVVSDAEIRNGEYFIPKGEAKRLTMIVLLMLPETAPTRSLDVALQVTNLPFRMVNGGVSIGARLNSSELQYYITPEVDISKGE